MIRFIALRIAAAFVVLFVVASATFFVLNLTGDPVTAVLQGTGASQEEIAALKVELGYDRPIIVRYGEFIWSVAHGDFGVSIRYGQPSIDMVMERLPYTLILGGTAIAIVVVLGLPIGILAALFRGGWFDRVFSAATGLAQSVPHFVVGPLLILFFAVLLGWLPVSGGASSSSIILPALTLALYPLALVSRVLRASMLETIEQDYVLTAESKGLSKPVIVLRHMARNALLPVLTVIALQIIAMIGGTIVVESIFSWPGLGSFARDTLLASDFPLAQTIIIFVAAAVVTINLVVDIVYALVDPRIRLK
ncbi:ABC transporter permease subunit [Nitratireductor sp. CAU 1489]|uniref:ABC transporter permease subunit n=1 Tax=Nitratireductor arenosus TaxID=2682096 RepID=A0A844QKI1_9HYPH|nr:ABC transporter permease [Nitratireductor arenosus]MVA98460.1 ABC transporter permease subunit [Nitratireductor arenosus]